jgi:hypothetical protein
MSSKISEIKLKKNSTKIPGGDTFLTPSKSFVAG